MASASNDSGKGEGIVECEGEAAGTTSESHEDF